MSLRRFSSIATRTTLTTGITAVSTGLTVTNNSGYPEPPFAIEIDDETIIVGNTTGNTFNTLSRGFDSSIAVAHSTAVDVEHVGIGDDYRYQWQDYALDRPHRTYDDEFGDADLDTAWVQINPSGTIVWSEANSSLSVKGENQTAAHGCALVKPLPVFPPYQVHTAMRLFATDEDFTHAGLIFTDGTSVGSNAIAASLTIDSTDNNLQVSQRIGTLNALGAASDSTYIGHVGPWLYVRLRWKAINLFDAEFSTDGISWVGLDWSDIFTTFTPTHAGFWFSSWGSATADSKVATFDYYRTEAYT